MARLDAVAAVRTAYDAQQALLVEWIGRIPDEAWSRPSRLPEWTVGELAFHTTEVPAAATRAVTAGPVSPSPQPASATMAPAMATSAKATAEGATTCAAFLPRRPHQKR